MEPERLKQLADALKGAERDREYQLTGVARPIIAPNLAGAVMGARVGVMEPTPVGKFGIGATLGAELARYLRSGELSAGPVRGLDLQYQGDNQRFGIGAQEGPRGTRWGILYGRQF